MRPPFGLGLRYSGFQLMRIAKLLVIVLLAFSTILNAELYIVAHFPYGDGWSTHLLLTNGSANPVAVELGYFTQGGQPAFVPFAGPEVASIRQLQIGPNQVATVDSDPSKRNAAGQVTWAIARSNGPLNIFTLFDYAPTSVPSTIPSTQIVAAVGGSLNTGEPVFSIPR